MSIKLRCTAELESLERQERQIRRCGTRDLARIGPITGRSRLSRTLETRRQKAGGPVSASVHAGPASQMFHELPDHGFRVAEEHPRAIREVQLVVDAGQPRILAA